MQPSKLPIRAALTVFGVIVAVLAFAGPASATPYTTTPTVTVRNQTPTVGSHVTVCGSGFDARSRVQITVGNRSYSSSDRTNRSGSFCTSIELPRHATGTQSIVVTDRQGHVATVIIEVVKKQGDRRDERDRQGWGSLTWFDDVSYNTGTSGSAADGTTLIAIIALGGLLLFGGVMQLTGRRRKDVR